MLPCPSPQPGPGLLRVGAARGRAVQVLGHARRLLILDHRGQRVRGRNPVTAEGGVPLPSYLSHNLSPSSPRTLAPNCNFQSLNPNPQPEQRPNRNLTHHLRLRSRCRPRSPRAPPRRTPMLNGNARLQSNDNLVNYDAWARNSNGF